MKRVFAAAGNSVFLVYKYEYKPARLTSYFYPTNTWIDFHSVYVYFQQNSWQTGWGSGSRCMTVYRCELREIIEQEIRERKEYRRRVIREAERKSKEMAREDRVWRGPEQPVSTWKKK